MTITCVTMKSKEQVVHLEPNIKGDRVNILLLILMYTLQNIISGFMLSFPVIFQNRKVSYADQAEFSLADYPVCLKLVWAPIVDCVFSKRIGRRKTWVIPTQYLMGFTLMYLSIGLDDWLGSEDGTTKPRVRTLAIVMIFCQLFAAVQDVALDAWALTMVQRRNVGYASFCQNIGSAIGQFLAYVGFIVLDSKDVCNRFRSVPKDYGFVTLSEFIFFWSIIIVISTTLIFIFKRDNSLEVIDDEDGECRLGLRDSYKYTWNIVKLRPMLMLCVMLLTYYWGFGPAIAVAHLKIIDTGIKRENFVLLTIPALPLQIISLIVLKNYITGPRPIRPFFTNFFILLITSFFLATALFFSPFVKEQYGMLPNWYYGVLLVLYNIRSVVKNFMVLSLCTLFCRISDPRYGGIYLTLMYTTINIGIRCPQTLSLWCVDPLTIQTCENNTAGARTCVKKFDGYYTETVLFTTIAVLWSWWGKKQLYRLQNLEASAWIPGAKEKMTTEDEKKLVQRQ